MEAEEAMCTHSAGCPQRVGNLCSLTLEFSLICFIYQNNSWPCTSPILLPASHSVSTGDSIYGRKRCSKTNNTDM